MKNPVIVNKKIQAVMIFQPISHNTNNRPSHKKTVFYSLRYQNDPGHVIRE